MDNVKMYLDIITLQDKENKGRCKNILQYTLNKHGNIRSKANSTQNS